jgi:hypothetical protein
LIILNPSTLTFLLDRLSSNLFKMIKVGIIITKRNVIIAFLSFALGALPPQHGRYLTRRPISAFSWVRIFLALAGNGRALELEADLGFRHD